MTDSTQPRIICACLHAPKSRFAQTRLDNEQQVYRECRNPQPRRQRPYTWELLSQVSPYRHGMTPGLKHVLRRAFGIDAGRTDAELGIAVLWKGLEVTAIDGTTMTWTGSRPCRPRTSSGHNGLRGPSSVARRARVPRPWPSAQSRRSLHPA